ncbi:MHYT domain-containing protein [Yinghuangia aomiensis]
MLGFSIQGTAIRYDVQRDDREPDRLGRRRRLGLTIVGYASTARRRAAGGRHGDRARRGEHARMGMSALWLRGSVDYATGLVAASVVIAVVAATAALWMAFNVRGTTATAVAALIMGVAVTGMHYTAMFSMSIDTGGSSGMLHGAEPVQFLAPLITGISLFTFVTLFIVALSPTEDEMQEEAELGARLDRP